MVGIPKTVAEEDDARIDKEPDEYAGSDNLGIGILVLVQVPSSTHAQKLTTVSYTVQDQYDEVDDLQEIGKF